MVRGTFSLAGALHPKIEPELAFHFADGLRGCPDRAEVLAACTGVCAALEILDSRYRDFKYFSLPDVVADNASSSHFVLPDAWTDAAGLHAGTGRARPCPSTAWCASAPREAPSPGTRCSRWCSSVRCSTAGGGRCRPGSLVLAGAATVAEPLRAGQTVSLDVPPLAPVRVAITP